MKKRIISMFMILMLMLSVMAIPAYAAGMPRGNGYEGFSIVYNNKNYSVSLSTSYSSNAGGRTQVYTEAAVPVTLDAPTVKYNTKNYGYITDSGSAASATLTDSNHFLATAYVPCSKGMIQVVNYAYISGGVTITANGKVYTSSVYGTP